MRDDHGETEQGGPALPDGRVAAHPDGAVDDLYRVAAPHRGGVALRRAQGGHAGDLIEDADRAVAPSRGLGPRPPRLPPDDPAAGDLFAHPPRRRAARRPRYARHGRPALAGGGYAGGGRPPGAAPRSRPPPRPAGPPPRAKAGGGARLPH